MITCPKEHDEQKALMRWVDLMAPQMPLLHLLYAVPNGGDRHPATAARLKAEGVKPGVPDLHLPVSRRGYHGLYIEMKRQKGGRLSPEQKQWKDDLQNQGHRVEVCHGFEEARDALLDYLK